MKLFLDTNILFDVLAKRQPFFEDSAAIWSLAEKGEVEGFISAISFNNVYYVMRRNMGGKPAMKALRLLRDIFHPIALDTQLLNQAMDAGFADFEDAIQYHSALRVNADALITRNAGDFRRPALAILTPAEFLAR